MQRAPLLVSAIAFLLGVVAEAHDRRIEFACLCAAAAFFRRDAALGDALGLLVGCVHGHPRIVEHELRTARYAGTWWATCVPKTAWPRFLCSCRVSERCARRRTRASGPASGLWCALAFRRSTMRAIRVNRHRGGLPSTTASPARSPCSIS